ncbi:MAG TPA: ornithine cyclodeaminase family protein [Anaerovoracaceae bacterium]|nr:ornithine cyclodeaminase family protein [Anaerovoracaceae bacterium]
MNDILILNAEEIKKLLKYEAVVKTVEEVYVQKADCRSLVFPLVFHEFELGVADMDIKSGWLMDSEIFGLKLVSWFGENQEKGLPMLMGTVLICDAKTGAPKGILDGSYLTGIRTGAAGAVGAKYLGKKDAKNMLMVGAGHVAGFMIPETILSVPSIKTVRIYDPIDIKYAQKLVDKLKVEYKEMKFVAVADIKEATKKSEIIITATPSKEPLIMNEWVKPGTHFSCIGSDMSGKEEIDPEILKGARIYVDDLEQNVNVGEIEIPIKNGVILKSDIKGEIGEVINGRVEGRTNDDDITVFDATGTALLDLLTGALALEEAQKQSMGTMVKL